MGNGDGRTSSSVNVVAYARVRHVAALQGGHGGEWRRSRRRGGQCGEVGHGGRGGGHCIFAALFELELQHKLFELNIFQVDFLLHFSQLGL